jgi:hypothetical protein
MATTKTAPATAAAQIQTAGDQLIGSIRQTQRLALDAASKWVEVVNTALPTLPPLPTLPGTPTKGDVEAALAASFGFAQELLAVQRELIDGLLAMTPTPAPV